MHSATFGRIAQTDYGKTDRRALFRRSVLHKPVAEMPLVRFFRQVFRTDWNEPVPEKLQQLW